MGAGHLPAQAEASRAGQSNTRRPCFRSILRRQESISTARVLPAAVPAAKRKHAVRFLLGVGFAFLLGPMLIAISVTLLLYANL